jgi:hypothetical protein
VVEARGSLHATSARQTAGRLNKWPATWSWTVLLAATVMIFSGLRLLAADKPQPIDLPYDSGNVVVVGSAGHYALTPGDQKILQERPAQVGAVSVRPRGLGDIGCGPPNNRRRAVRATGRQQHRGRLAGTAGRGRHPVG